MMIHRFALTTLAAAAMLSGSVHAATTPLTGLEVLQQFSQVTLGSATSTTETIGRAWIGGTVAGGQYAMSSSLPASSYAGLTVIGSASGFRGGYNGVNIGGSASNGDVQHSVGASFVGGNSANTNYQNPTYITGTITNGNLNGGGHVGLLGDSASHVNGSGLSSASQTLIATNTEAATSTNFATVLGGLSTDLSKLQGNSSVEFNSQGVVFNAVSNNGVAVFDLTALAHPGGSDLTQLDDLVFAASSITFNLNGATSVIINTDNTSISTAANFKDPTVVGSSLIWNMYKAGSVSIGTEWGGSVLAIGASFTNGNSIDGGVYSASITQRGEIHQYNYSGAIPTAVPEADTYAMLLAGLGLMGFIARRRKQAAAR
ncbi:collagen-binding domain-containing protein [Duganella aceris]|uniref:PEP-CTERM sorting domain-containing protein n=1 Tax=Duganella aceris TaxID=2703883 RepID=A0ABX0FMN1_9BURK|nr:collagen-binding domain-containing protein [Duganella aceris]NGZ85870.1 PEP-CTERM sorting domain-containing protein [Duganella aceris]